jgi:hypothetical protein
MPRPVRALALLLLAAACARPGPVPPDARTADSRDAVRAVETTGRSGDRVLGLTQGRVRACSGSYAAPTARSPVRSTDLACTGGVTGSATVDRDGTVHWRLDTGESGTVRL